jgi:D-hexose-6-phosphate mutarotase
LIVTVAETMTMELCATNETARTLEFENCLHTYLGVGDISAVTLSGLQGGEHIDNSGTGKGAHKTQTEPVLKITEETNRIYTNTNATVEIRDEKLKRVIRVDKSQSQSTVVWNPWTTQKLPDDFDPAEHRHMVCVESGNVKQNQISLAPGAVAALRVVLSSAKID